MTFDRYSSMFALLEREVAGKNTMWYQGGFANVYLGEHIHLLTQAAVKVLHTALANHNQIEKFRNEARIIAQLKHAHIVQVLDFGLEDDTPFLVMSYAPQGSLQERVPSILPDVERVVMTALAKDPKQRFAVSIHVSSGDTMPGDIQQIKITTINPANLPPVLLPSVSASTTPTAYSASFLRGYMQQF